MQDAVDRRGLIMGALAAGGAALAANPAVGMDLRQLSPLGFQAHSLREAVKRDFAGTMRVMRTMGYEAVELASFPGFAGNLRGDFGELQSMPATEIRRVVSDAGLRCTSAHFLGHEFTPERLPRTLDWARGVGLTHMVYAGLDLPNNPTIDQLKGQLDILNEAGARVRAGGLQMGFHSHHAIYRQLSGVSALEETMRRLDPASVQIQMDFGTVIQTGTDGAAVLARYPGRFFSVHLRDGKPPADTWAYLPASPLGAGGNIDWARVIASARSAGIRNFVVEMTLPQAGVFDSFKASHDYLRTL